MASESESSALGLLGRSRVWVALFAVGLAGLVFLQGELRGLNSGIGGSVQSITKLERQNALMRAEISGLTSDSRIYAEAGRMGFVEPPVGSAKYLSAGRGDAARALASMTAPSAARPAVDGSGQVGTGQGVDPSGSAVSVASQDGAESPVSTTASVPDQETGSASATGG